MARLSLNSSRKTKTSDAGEIPVDWGCMQLADFVRQPVSGVSVLASDDPPEKGQPGVLRLSCVTGGKFNPKDLKTPIASEVHRLTEFADADSIIISRSNTPDLVGASAYVSRRYPNAFLPDTLWALYKKAGNISMRWLSLVLQSDSYSQKIQSIAHGTSDSMKKIQKGSFLKLPVMVPPLPEQQKIADILGMWDEALEKLDALIGAKDRRKQALMRQLLTGARRLPGFNKKWVRAKLGDLFENRTESNRLDLSLLSITADHGVVRRDTLIKRDTSSEDKSKYLRIAPGDIGYNTMRMWQGVSALSSLEGIVSPAYTICIPTKHIDGQFVAHFFKLPHTISLFHRHSQGLVDDTLNLKFPHFATIEVTVPSDVTEQRAIAAVFDTSDAELRLLRQQRTALDHQKRGLMQQLLTGKIRVNLS